MLLAIMQDNTFSYTACILSYNIILVCIKYNNHIEISGRNTFSERVLPQKQPSLTLKLDILQTEV